MTNKIPFPDSVGRRYFQLKSETASQPLHHTLDARAAHLKYTCTPQLPISHEHHLPFPKSSGHNTHILAQAFELIPRGISGSNVP